MDDAVRGGPCNAPALEGYWLGVCDAICLDARGAISYPLAPMRYLIHYSVLLAVGLGLGTSVFGQSPIPELGPLGQPVVRQHGVLLLRNGQVMVGEIAKMEDRFSIMVEGGEVRLHQRDVQCVCRDLMDAYRQKRLQVREDYAQDHLELAQWCQSHGLLGVASEELKIAAELNPSHPLIPLIDRKIRMSVEQRETRCEQPVVSSASSGPSVEELDRMVAGMPSGAVEMFTQTIQPMLTNNCTVSGCHSAEHSEGFHLLRIPSGRPPSRRLTQRNLYAVIGLIRWEDPSNSPLLTAPIKPHGTSRTAMFTDRQVGQYQDLVRWVYLVVLGKKIEREEPKAVTKAVHEEGRLPDGAVRAASHEEAVREEGMPFEGEVGPGATTDWLGRAAMLGNGTESGDLRFRQGPLNVETSEPQPGSVHAGGRVPGQHRSGGTRPHVQRGAKVPQFTPIDSFDAEIFNRQFAPHPAAPPKADP